MNIAFYKYEGAGNDFILTDNRKGFFPKEPTSFIQKLCHRHFGIDAGGWLLLGTSYEIRFCHREL